VLHNTLLAQAKFIYAEVQKYLAEQRQPGSTAAAAAAAAAASAADSSTAVAAAAAAAPLPEIACLRIYGELLGGKCDHPDAPGCTATYSLGGVGNRRVSKVQNDAFPQYSRSLHFFAFQVNYTVDEADLPDGWERYERSEATLPYDATQEIFARTPNNWLYAKPLLRGPIQKVACLPSDFMTTIPMHLPTLNKGLGNAYIRNNRAEGLIIRSTLLGTPQAAQMEVSSLLLKAKSPFFQELRHKLEDPTKKRADPMANAREAAIAKYGTQMTDIGAAFPPEWLPMARHLVDHVAPQRLSAVVSKIGPEAIVNGSVGGQRGLAYLLAKDALKDFLKGCEKATLFCPLLVRRELARYALFESKKLVAESWADLVAQAGGEDSATSSSDAADAPAPAEGGNSSGTASASGGTTAFAAAAAAPSPASTAQ
jgi:RNA-editing ligase